MNPEINLCFVGTVSSNYSWDDGLPDISNLTPIREALSAPSNNPSGLEYVCYAPYAAVLLSSTNTVDPSAIKTTRTVDYGDYYNLEQNTEVTTSIGNYFFSHVYVMPGVYTITLTEEQYLTVPNPEKFPSDAFIEQSSVINNVTEKYNIPTKWHWSDYRDISEKYFPTTWQNLKFQKTLKFDQPKQITWANTKECISELEEPVYWLWNNLKNFIPPDNPNAVRIKWNDAVAGGAYQKKWNQIGGNCYLKDFIISATPVQTITKQAYIRVKEIFPTAYLSGNQTTEVANRKFPLTVRLTPKYTQCGSFPIEKIVWDLGDGSPIITRRRWENGSKFPFVYSGALSADPQDPRNYDIVYTYEKRDRGQYTFYPSITAYASSTGSADIASTTIGPIKTENFSVSSFVVTQNYIGDSGTMLLGEVDQTAAIWKVNN